MRTNNIFSVRLFIDDEAFSHFSTVLYSVLELLLFQACIPGVISDTPMSHTPAVCDTTVLYSNYIFKVISLALGRIEPSLQ